MNMSTICHAIVQLTAATTITVFVYRKTPDLTDSNDMAVDATAWSLTLLCLFSLFLKGDYLIITTLQQRKKTRIMQRRSSSSNIKGKIILFIQWRTNVCRLAWGEHWWHLSANLMNQNQQNLFDSNHIKIFTSNNHNIINVTFVTLI